jgi:hypothetical protein
MARVIVPAALAGAVDEEDTGAERPFLCYKKPVARRPCAAISVFRVPHFTDLGGFATSIRSQPIEAGGQVVLPDGRVTPRLPVNPEGRARDAVCKSLPGTSVRSTSTAGAAPRPHFQNHLRRRPRVSGMSVRIRGLVETGTTFFSTCPEGVALCHADWRVAGEAPAIPTSFARRRRLSMK